MAQPQAQRPASALRNLLTHEASGGLILIASAAIALAVANSPASGFYSATLAHYVFGLSALHWINDALMALFFSTRSSASCWTAISPVGSTGFCPASPPPAA